MQERVYHNNNKCVCMCVCVYVCYASYYNLISIIIIIIIPVEKHPYHLHQCLSLQRKVQTSIVVNSAMNLLESQTP